MSKPNPNPQAWLRDMLDLLPDPHLIQEETRDTWAALRSQICEKLHLVSRETFDIQSEVLQRSITQLQALQARLAELETLLSSSKE